MNIARPKRRKVGNNTDLTTALADTGSELRSLGTSTKSTIESAPQPELLVIVDQRDFVRGCLTCWLDKYCSEFTTLAVADIVQSWEAAVPRPAVAALIGVGPLEESNGWLVRQIEWIRASQPNIPILMIVDAKDTRETETRAVLLGARGYISTYTSAKVAAAVVRLVVAGGRYFPRTWNSAQSQISTDKGPERETVGSGALESLTHRERVVVTALSRGSQNKDIADQLGMSVSTVKAHVHHIIRKLNVRNRTEVVLATRSIRLG